MNCELGFNGQVICSDGRIFAWRQGAWVQLWPPSGAAAAAVQDYGQPPEKAPKPRRVRTGSSRQTEG
jgi:hypothetical protein